MSRENCSHQRRFHQRPWRHESQFAEELTRWVAGIVDRVVDAIVDVDDRARSFAERWHDGGDPDDARQANDDETRGFFDDEDAGPPRAR